MKTSFPLRRLTARSVIRKWTVVAATRGQWTRRAVSGRSNEGDLIAGFDPERKFACPPLGQKSRSCARASLNHLIGLRQQQLRHGEVECFGSLEIEGKPKPSRLLERQIRWFRALYYAVDEGGLPDIAIV